MAHRLTRTAAEQIEVVLLKSARVHGIDAARRYQRLIRVMIAAIDANPLLPGSRAVSRLAGVRAYHARLARTKIEPAERVRAPRHILVYRVVDEGLVEVLALIHDRMALRRAAGRAVRGAEPS